MSGPREEEDQQKDCRLFLRLLRRLLPSTDTDIKPGGGGQEEGGGGARPS